MIERTLVLLKPDAVQRCVIGEIISRFEKAGLKIIGMKMNYVSEDQARKHYDEDLEKRRGKEVRDSNIRFILVERKLLQTLVCRGISTSLS